MEVYQNDSQPRPRPICVTKPRNRAGFFFGGCLCGCLTAILLPAALIFAGISSCSKFFEQAENTTVENLNLGMNGTVLQEGSTEKQIAVISIKGIIGHYDDEGFFNEKPSGDATRILKNLQSIEKNSSFAALVLDMNTPGGEVVASDEIRHALDKLEIPVVTCMRSMAASGGYYIASGSDWIVANPMTLTGSIGVILHGVQYKGLYEKLGLKDVVYRSGDFKDILNGAREATPQEDAYLNAMVQSDFRHFCQMVSEGRNAFYPSAEDVAKAVFGDGRPLSGDAALEANLVDQLGDFEDAIAKARELGDCPDGRVIALQGTNDFRDFFRNMAAPAAAPRIHLEGLSPSTVLPAGNRFFLPPESLR